MKRELTFAVDTQITVIYDDEKCNGIDAIDCARDLAFNPNFHTIEGGAQLKKFIVRESRYSILTKKEHNLPSEDDTTNTIIYKKL